jgi:hypothetical protein
MKSESSGLAEDDSAHAEGSASGGGQSALDFYSGLRRPQSGSNATSGRRRSSGVSRSRDVSPARSSYKQRPHKHLKSNCSTSSNDERQKEKSAANQFFSSLLDRPSTGNWFYCNSDGRNSSSQLGAAASIRATARHLALCRRGEMLQTAGGLCVLRPRDTV